jgi:hypothetical protein
MLTVGMKHGHRSVRRFAGLGLAATLLLALVPGSAAAAPKAYTYDLGTRADFVAQTNSVQCVGASMQMMLNMIRPGADGSAATQRRLQNPARAWSGQRPDGRERRGASIRGLAAGLTVLGAGPYKVAGSPTIDGALLMAARAMAATGKPVGLLVWRGRHAWVMSGFQATKDPFKAGARVTAAIVEDPLYPAGSETWGRSPAPGEALSLKELGRQFVPRRGSWSSPHLDNMYIVVLPYKFDPRILRQR